MKIHIQKPSVFKDPPPLLADRWVLPIDNDAHWFRVLDAYPELNDKYRWGSSGSLINNPLPMDGTVAVFFYKKTGLCRVSSEPDYLEQEMRKIPVWRPTV